MIVFPKINLIVNNVPLVRTSLSIELCELALVVINACALIYLIFTRENVAFSGIRYVVPLILVNTTILSSTIATTWNRCHKTSGVYN